MWRSVLVAQVRSENRLTKHPNGSVTQHTLGPEYAVLRIKKLSPMHIQAENKHIYIEYLYSLCTKVIIMSHTQTYVPRKTMNAAQKYK